MADDKKKSSDDRPIDFNLDLGLGGLFSGLTDMIGKLNDLAEQADNMQGDGPDGMRTFNIKGLGKDAEAVMGIRIRHMDGSKSPVVERFGNVRPTDKGPEVADVREPMVDVFDEEDELVLVAELPGVADEEITLSVEDDILTLETSGTRRYAKEILLPAPVETTPASRAYTNGILEIRLTKS